MEEPKLRTTPDEAASRSEIETDVLQQITDEVRDAIFLHSPQSWTQKSRDAIEECILDHTRLVMEALSTHELQSEGALRAHIAQAVAEAKRLIHMGGALRRAL